MAKTLFDIKRSLECHVGQRLTLRANGGRKKMVERFGTLAETYPSVFIIELDKATNTYERVSYSYADVLTQTVQLVFLDEDTLAVSGQ